MNKMTKMFSIDGADAAKALLMAILGGIILPVSVIVQSPGFDIATANWSVILGVAINGAIAGFTSYIIKNFFSDESGKFLGRIG